MDELDDQQLLAEYARNKSEAAFTLLVSRYSDFVFSAAKRQLNNNEHLAEDVTQAVFLILANKAGSLKSKTVLSGWLHETARRTSLSLIKSETRRQKREQEAYMQSIETESESAIWDQISPLLDEAMGRLKETDRNAILLRFFERKTTREVAAKLGVNEKAAQKRVLRAVANMGAFFAKRGVALSAAAIIASVSANSVHAAPASLAASVTSVVSHGAAAGGSSATLAQGVLKMMAWAKLKLALGIGAGLVLATAATPSVWHYAVTHFGANAWHSRFEQVYGLKPGEILKHIGAPYIPERNSYYANEKSLAYQTKTTLLLPDAFTFKQESNGLRWTRLSRRSYGLHLEDALQNVFGIGRQDLGGDKNLLNMKFDGDWTVRPGADQAELMRVFLGIVREQTGLNIQIEKRTVQREVIVARGSCKDDPSVPTAEPPHSDLFINDKNLINGSGNAEVGEFLSWVGNWLNIPIINEVAAADQSKRVGWRLDSKQDAAEESGAGGTVADRELKNLASQSGLTFTREHREVEVWFVSETKN